MELAIIGGTGALKLFRTRSTVALTTPFGAPSDRPRRVECGAHEFWFLARHGDPHRIPPHRVNYRANIHALKSVGADTILAINAVGGIDAAMSPGDIVIPDQLIDYTSGRVHTFSDGGSAPLKHIDFTHPYRGRLRQSLVEAIARAGLEAIDGGCHAVVQGPRLETAAEVRRLARDGCTIVGMTGMPEAALAREAGLDYASLCVVANAAAGLEDQAITEADIHRVLESAMEKVRAIVAQIQPVP
ncbi:MAG: S-methyl-5'-thioinosine phosphorylase [Wenzhouxiangellaceae bacterium]|nr:S-methyl-5'-thioinosine phosphorylase [Wenzhouxiangellaceae bacterium]